MTDFLVIGAGLAGLAFAGDAAASGASVRLLDKGRGVGGRTATRRFGDLRVDHGAQYF
ncbi:MAG: NAD(P)-binding protein, partial [Cytophagales bacterium]|nr:NAD(P)-binding protein [Armatimonadota bacterium]